MKTMLSASILALLMAVTPVSGDYAGIAVEETAGIARDRWPVQVGVTVPAEAAAGTLRLVQVDAEENLREIPFQLIAEIDSHGLDQRWRQLRNIKSFEIAFLTPLPAHASLDFRLYYNPPQQDIAPPVETYGLSVSKEDGLGRTIDTGVARFAFDPKSGQMIQYRLAGSEYTPQLFRGDRHNPVHGSGDLRTSRNNVRSWNIEEESHAIQIEETSGTVTWQLVRCGFMPHTDRQVEVTVTYTAYAGMPFLYTSSHIQFHSDWAVSALRNNQLVFSRGHHTHGVYITDDGQAHVIRAFDPEEPNTYFDRLGLEPLSPDIPFLGMLHESRGHGIGLIPLGRANIQGRQTLSPQDGGAYFHFLDSSLHGVGSPNNFFYLVRYEACQGNHQMVIPAGSVFSSRTAILAYPVGNPEVDTRYDELKRWVRMLRNPPRVLAR